MKVGPGGVLFFITIFFAIVAVIGAVVTVFGLGFAYALTLMLSNLEMRQALTPGAVCAGFSLYFCVRFFTHMFADRTPSCSCDECTEKGADDDEYATAMPRPFVSRGAGTKQTRRKAAYYKGMRWTGDKR
jgi:hypothetical protein